MSDMNRLQFISMIIPFVVAGDLHIVAFDLHFVIFHTFAFACSYNNQLSTG